MRSLNSASILGNLTRDPELRQTPGGQTCAQFAIATSRIWKGKEGDKQEETEYHDVVAWGKLADLCGSMLKKGGKAYVQGRLRTRKWEKDGVKHYRTEIVADDVIFLTGPEKGDSREEPEKDSLDQLLEM